MELCGENNIYRDDRKWDYCLVDSIYLNAGLLPFYLAYIQTEGLPQTVQKCIKAVFSKALQKITLFFYPA